MSIKSKPLATRKPTIRKETEFNVFVEIMKDPSSAPYMTQIAESLGVAKETLSEWNKQPEVIKAKTEGATRFLTKMEQSGEGDWKMWKEKLNMLGLTVVNKTDVTSGGKPLQTLIGGTSVLSNDSDQQTLTTAQTD